jgi:hypothetical protein
LWNWIKVKYLGTNGPAANIFLNLATFTELMRLGYQQAHLHLQNRVILQDVNHVKLHYCYDETKNHKLKLLFTDKRNTMIVQEKWSQKQLTCPLLQEQYMAGLTYTETWCTQREKQKDSYCLLLPMPTTEQWCLQKTKSNLTLPLDNSLISSLIFTCPLPLQVIVLIQPGDHGVTASVKQC